MSFACANNDWFLCIYVSSYRDFKVFTQYFKAVEDSFTFLNSIIITKHIKIHFYIYIYSLLLSWLLVNKDQVSEMIFLTK